MQTVLNVIHVTKTIAGPLIVSPWRLKPEEIQEHKEKSGDEIYLQSKLGQARSSILRSLGGMVGIAKIQDTSSDEYKAMVAKVREGFSLNLLSELEFLGIQLPIDSLDMSMSIGTVIFDLYEQFAVVPEAPIAVARHRNRLAALSEDVLKPEFEISPEILSVIEKPASNDELWKKAHLSLGIIVGQETRYMKVKALAINNFPKVLEALGGLFDTGAKQK